MNFIGINITKYVQDLYAEKYKAVIKRNQRRSKRTGKNWRNRIDHAYGLLKFNIINMSILIEMIYRFNATPIKTPADFLYKQADSNTYTERPRN